jgi:Ni,Fe-hydrogenase maturation factor
VVIVGIQPADITPYGIELTPVVAAKVDELIDRVLDELKVFGIVAQKKV